MSDRPEGIAARVGAQRAAERAASGADDDQNAAGSGPEGPPVNAADLSARIHTEQHTLEAELTEIELLTQQARTEASRHESKRAAAAERLTALGPNGNPTDVADQSRQLVMLTRRALVMQAQVDVLEGKLKVLQRFRDSSAQVAADLDQVRSSGTMGPESAAEKIAREGTRTRSKGGAGRATPGSAAEDGDADGADVLPPAVSRMVLGAQEDLRREIARTMHDGPAQSLTNIVLQAQIVQRLLARDPASAAAEVGQLVSMVQQTLDATKSFIFDVRPMVLDDLGLVPTIRRAARERGRRAQVPVDFESYGTDRRLSMELESGLFRIIDETLAGYLAGHPDRVSIRLDWSDGLEARIAAHRPAAAAFEPGTLSAAAVADDAARAQGVARGRGRGKMPAQPQEAMPAALAAMIEDRRAADTASKRAVGGLPTATQREIRQRAATLGLTLEIAADGQEVAVMVDGPAVVEATGASD